MNNKPAFIIDTFVRVAPLSVYSSVILDVLEGVVHKTATAAIVAVLARTIDEILL